MMKYDVTIIPRLTEGMTADDAEIDDSQVGEEFKYQMHVEDGETHEEHTDPEEVAIEKALDEFHGNDCPIGVLDYVEIETKAELIEGDFPNVPPHKVVPNHLPMIARVARTRLDSIDVVISVPKGSTSEEIDFAALKAVSRGDGHLHEGDQKLSVTEYRTLRPEDHHSFEDLGEGFPVRSYNLVNRLWGAIENGTVSKQHTTLRGMVREQHDAIKEFGVFFAAEFGLLLCDLASGDYDDVEKRIKVIADQLGVNIDPDPLRPGEQSGERL